MKVMIVDDSKAMRMIVMRTLRQAGFGNHALVEATSGADALAQMQAGRPDVILADWNMPEMNGIDLLRKLKADGVPVKLGFITSESSDETRQLALSEGALFLVCKPFTADSLRAALAPVLG